MLAHEPYNTYRDFINVHVLWLTSPNPAIYGYYESGIDWPAGKMFWHTTTKVEVDNTDICSSSSDVNCFEIISGAWTSEAPSPAGDPTLDPLYFGDDYLVANEANAEVRWKFVVPEYGDYKIWAFYTNDPSKSNGGK